MTATPPPMPTFDRAFERYASDFEERQRYLRDLCKRQGIEIADDLIKNDLAYWESRLAAAVLSPNGGRASLLLPTLRACFGSILDLGQRTTHGVWATGLALAPRAVAHHLLAQRFLLQSTLPSRRSDPGPGLASRRHKASPFQQQIA